MHEGEQQSHVVHRVALFDSSGHVTTVISQTDIVRWLAAHAGGGTLGGLAGATIGQLGWGSKPVGGVRVVGGPICVDLCVGYPALCTWAGAESQWVRGTACGSVHY